MELKTAGEVLRNKRLEKGWTVNEAVEATRIKKRYIIALEEDDYESIPGSFYVRAYIKQYADRLGIDYSPLINYYESGELINVYGGTISSEPLEEEEPQIFEEISGQEVELEKPSLLERLRGNLPVILLSAAAVLILGGVCAVAFVNRPSAPLASAAKHAKSSEESSESSVEEKVEEPSSEAAPQPVKPKVEQKIEVTGSGAAITANVTDATDPLEVEISLTDGTRSWISVTNSDLAGGDTLDAAKKSVTTKLTPQATTSVITLGMVPGVSIKVGGQPVDLAHLTTLTGTITLQITYKNSESETAP